VNSISRAVSLCESTLAFGKAEEPSPTLRRLNLAHLVGEVAEGEGLGAETQITCLIDIARPDGARRWGTAVPRAVEPDPQRPPGDRGDRPARHHRGIGRRGRDRMVDPRRRHRPRPAAKAREHLFAAFQGGARKGGTGLGLAIAAELVRGHGGQLELARSDSDGTEFLIHLPKATTDTDG
jgi:hypothetical protein